MRFMSNWGTERIGYDFFCDIAERIVEGRKRSGLTQEMLAEATKLSVAKIRKMETVGIRPELKDLESIAKVLDVSVDWLIDAHLDCHGKNCRYLVWNERMDGETRPTNKSAVVVYFDASSARMAYLKAHAWSRELGMIWFEPRDRAMVQLVGVPIEKADLEARLPRRPDRSDDPIEHSQ